MADTEEFTQCRDWRSHLVIPLEIFAGQNLVEVIAEQQEKGSAQRKLLEAKIAAVRAAAEAIRSIKPAEASKPVWQRDVKTSEAVDADVSSGKIEETEGEGETHEGVKVEGAKGKDVTQEGAEEEGANSIHEGAQCSDAAHDANGVLETVHEGYTCEICKVRICSTWPMSDNSSWMGLYSRTGLSGTVGDA